MNEKRINIQDPERNLCKLKGLLRRGGYDSWRHCFTGASEDTGESRRFFIEFCLVNPASGQAEPVFEEQPSWLLVKCGVFGEKHKELHRYIGWNKVDLTCGTHFQLKAEDCVATEYMLKGNVNLTQEEVDEHPEYLSDAGSMYFELLMDKELAVNASKAPGILWHGEGVKTLYKGTVVLDGERYRVAAEGSYGYADKVWGSRPAMPWVCLSSHHLVSRFNGELKNSAFAIMGGEPRGFSLSSGNLLFGGFCYEEEEHEYNDAKPFSLTQTRFEGTENDDEIRMNVVQENMDSIMHTIIVCKKKDMLPCRSLAPDGGMMYETLLTGGTGKGRIRLYKKTPGHTRTLVDDIAVYDAFCEYGEF